MAEYVNPAATKETDPYLYSQRGALSGLMALPGSGQTLSPAEFSALLGGGRTYDPTFGIYQQDPRNMSDVERVRQNMLNSTGNPGRTVTDSAGNAYRLPSSSQTTRIGDKQYFVNPDGTVTSYDVQDINYGYTPGFSESTKEVQDSNTEGSSMASSASDTGASDTNTGATEDVTDTKPKATEADIQALYQELLGGPAEPAGVEYWLSRGMTVDSLRNSIAQSPEGVAYADTNKVSEKRQEYIDSLSADTPALPPGLTAEVAENLQFILDRIAEGNATEEQKDWYNNQYLTGNYLNNPDNFVATKNYDPQLIEYYQELFNRAPSQAGLDYFNQRLRAGAYDPANLRSVLINEAGPLDSLYYQGSQSGDPVFSATQALFGRRPARGIRNPDTREFTGGYGQYMRNLESGQLTEDQLRRDLVQLAYDRGAATGQSNDYQAYLNTLGIDRANSPFAIDGGFANVPYGSDLEMYRDKAAETPPGDDTPPGDGTPPRFPFPGFPGFPGGNRIPGQYITGNQLYSGLPYGMTMPYGMMDFTQPMSSAQPMGFAQPMGMGFMSQMPYQPPQLSQQYMPSRGLMAGFPTGFGSYSGFQRPRFGGGKGGGFGGYNPYGVGGGLGVGKGGGYGAPMYQQQRAMPYAGAFNPYAMGGGYNFGQSSGQTYEDVVRAGGGGINPVIGPNGERLSDL